jgi:hypothetical protein
MSDSDFSVVDTATKRTNGYSETKDELDTALGKAHTDAHVLAELDAQDFLTLLNHNTYTQNGSDRHLVIPNL